MACRVSESNMSMLLLWAKIYLFIILVITGGGGGSVDLLLIPIINNPNVIQKSQYINWKEITFNEKYIK